MRTLEFSTPYKVNRTTLNREYLNKYDSGDYERSTGVLTKYGVVMVSEIKWTTNSGMQIYTRFETIINQLHYSAWLAESKLSDRCIKWMATHFIKLAINQTTTPTPKQ